MAVDRHDGGLAGAVVDAAACDPDGLGGVGKGQVGADGGDLHVANLAAGWADRLGRVARGHAGDEPGDLCEEGRSAENGEQG